MINVLMMDKYFVPLISSSWVDGDAKESSSWDCGEPDQTRLQLPSSFGLDEHDKRNSPRIMISSNHSLECLATQDALPLITSEVSDPVSNKGIIFRETQPQNQGRNCNADPSLNGITNGNLSDENISLQYDSTPTRGSLNLDYPKQLPVAVVGDLTPPFSFTEAGNFRCNVSEQSDYNRFFKNLHNFPSTSQLWSSTSYESMSSLFSLTEQESVQGFVHRGGIMDDDINTMGKSYVKMDKILQGDQMSASVTTKGKKGLQDYPLPSFTVLPNLASNGISSFPQTTYSTPTGGCSGTGKPRIRARRGQATDPHSIAERLRREKIAERMKSLQELVPNSNKIDKASMLDEIIEYVKFLQLQVKVLSMSRLGAAGAVIPLITDGQAEGFGSLSLSPSAGLGIGVSPSSDEVAFEEEVLKLMESSVTMAMQYLQSKGLCLMPIALATAISTGKTTLTETASEDRKKFGFTNGLVPNSSSCLPGTGNHLISCNGKLSSKGVMVNDCNGTVKQEEFCAISKN